MGHKNKNPAYREWENKLKPDEKKEWKKLVELAKEFRKKFKKPVFIVNRNLKKKR